MADTSRPDPMRREPLTRERVLGAAVELADAEGLKALSMRRLAKALGVEAMTLYHHVSSKAEMLNAIVDLVEGEIDLPSGAGTWREGLRRVALSYRQVHSTHPWAATMALSPTGPRPSRQRYMEAVLGCLTDAGLTPSQVDHGYHVIDSYIAGFTLWVSQLDIAPEELDELAQSFLREIGDEQPHLAAHVRWHLQPPDPGDAGTFAFGLDLILDGLERLRFSGDGLTRDRGRGFPS
jgi:AcrR family transcriptional regulator